MEKLEKLSSEELKKLNKNEIESIRGHIMLNKKIIVEVEQNGKIVSYWTDENQNMMKLLGFLYSIQILKDKSNKIKYSYNYSDLQKITITNTYINNDGIKSTIKYNFYNIPTNCGYLDIYKISERI